LEILTILIFKQIIFDEKIKLVFKDDNASTARAHEFLTFNSRSAFDPSGSNTFTLGHNALVISSESLQYGILMPGPDGANVPITSSTAMLWVGGYVSASGFSATSITASYFSASVPGAAFLGTASYAVAANSSFLAISSSQSVTSSYAHSAVSASYILASDVDTSVPFDGTVTANIISSSGQLFAGIAQGTISEADAEIAIYDTNTGNFYYTSSDWIQKQITVAGADYKKLWNLVPKPA
jgi:hypothetical protein